MPRHARIHVWLFLRRARWAFALCFGWFASGALIFHHVLGLPWGESIVDALYLGRDPSAFWDVYSFWGQCVLFGIVVSVFLLQAMLGSNPQEAARMIARELRNHTVVVGYTHLGSRIVEHLRSQREPFVVIDKDGSAVDHLVRLGEAVIVDDAQQASTLEDAGVHHARTVIVASNNLETALLVTKRTRGMNAEVKIVVRCYHDEFAEILEHLGATQVVSSSKSAFLEIETHLRGSGAG